VIFRSTQVCMPSSAFSCFALYWVPPAILLTKNKSGCLLHVIVP
jgi:hypothetical protein